MHPEDKELTRQVIPISPFLLCRCPISSFVLVYYFSILRNSSLLLYLCVVWSCQVVRVGVDNIWFFLSCNFLLTAHISPFLPSSLFLPRRSATCATPPAPSVSPLQRQRSLPRPLLPRPPERVGLARNLPHGMIFTFLFFGFLHFVWS